MSAEIPRGSLVTGGARGIGLAISRTLAARGDAVVIADVDGAEAEAQADLLRGVGHEARAVPLDVTDTDELRRAVAAIDVETPLAATAGPSAHAGGWRGIRIGGAAAAFDAGANARPTAGAIRVTTS